MESGGLAEYGRSIVVVDNDVKVELWMRVDSLDQCAPVCRSGVTGWILVEWNHEADFGRHCGHEGSQRKRRFHGEWLCNEVVELEYAIEIMKGRPARED